LLVNQTRKIVLIIATMKNQKSGKTFLGFLLIVLGGVFLLQQTDVSLPFEIPSFLFKWPMILILLGLFFFFTRENRTTGLILLFIGLFFLAPHVFSIQLSDVITYAIPVFLIIAGLVVLFPRTLGGIKKKEEWVNKTEGKTVIATHVFSGGKTVIQSEEFAGGEVVCIFGSADIIFHENTKVPESAFLEISCIFGGCNVFIPEDWTVITDTSTIFAGVEDQRYRSGRADKADPSKVLHIKGSLIFSGLEIKQL